MHQDDGLFCSVCCHFVIMGWLRSLERRVVMMLWRGAFWHLIWGISKQPFPPLNYGFWGSSCHHFGKLWEEFIILLNKWQIIYSWILFPVSFSQRTYLRMIAVLFHTLCLLAGLSVCVSLVFYSSGAAFWVYVFFFLSFIFYQLFIWRLLDAFFFSPRNIIDV